MFVENTKDVKKLQGFQNFLYPNSSFSSIFTNLKKKPYNSALKGIRQLKREGEREKKNPELVD